MPLVKLQTNISVPAKEIILKSLSLKVAEVFAKPESFVQVILEDEVAMTFGGETKPTLYAEMYSLGLDESLTETYAKCFSAFFEEKLGIAQARIYIQFNAPKRHLWGWNAKTFRK